MNRGAALVWEGCVNARDLGGLGRIRSGAIVRMEAPTGLTDVGWAAALTHGVRTVIDLRNPDEISADLSPRPAALTTLEVPQDPVDTPFYVHWSAVDHLASPLYFPAMLIEYPGPVISAVRAIANAAPGGVVFHCAGGKDRTGLLAMVLLILAGAEPEEIIADYLLTYEKMEPRYEAMGAGDQLLKVRKLLADHGTTVEESLHSTITSLSMPEFLLQNGLSDTELGRLTDRLYVR